MTTPANTIRRGAHRGYLVNDEFHIGVTSLIRSTLADPQSLANWKDRRLVESALNIRAELDSVVIDQEEIVARTLKARFDSGPEAQRGTDVHAAIEEYEAGGEMAITDADILKYLGQWQRIKEEHDLDVVWTERTLVNTTHKYAGTADGLFFGHLAPYRQDRFLYDIKTGKGIYDNYALQLALLSRCDAWLTVDGDLVPLDERWNTDVGLIVKLGPRSHHLHRVDLHKAWKYARLLIDLYTWADGIGSTTISASLPGKTELADRKARDARRLEILDRARQLDADIRHLVVNQWDETWPKLTDPSLDWTHDLLDQVDALIANAERGAIA